MKKIAIFNCNLTNRGCSGSGCLRAFNQKIDAFSRYENEDIELVSFARCNGCGQNLTNDEKLLKKVNRIRDLADVVHFGGCTIKNGIECTFITRLAHKLEQEGVEVVRGTHGSKKGIIKDLSEIKD